MRRPWCLIPLVGLFTAIAHGEPAATKDARELLTKANAASAALSAVSYIAKIYGEGPLSAQVPAMTGTVLARKSPPNGIRQIRIEATTVARTQTAEGVKEILEPVKFVHDGQQIFLLEENKKLLTSGKPDMATLQPVYGLFQDKFLTDAAYRDEVRTGNAVHDGEQTINGVDCDIVSVKYDANGMRTARLFLGKQDSLLRRIEHGIAFRMPGKQEIFKGQVIFNIEGLDVHPKLEDKAFVLDAPPGYRRDTFKIEPTPGAGATIGSDAPDWELTSSEGTKISLKSLRGKFVIMDFWATWCGPCKMAMPGMQKLHERFKDKPVVVYGANCWERAPNADPMAFIKSKNFTYPQLLKADQAAVAYGVSGIPAIFLIGPDGKILHQVRGFDPRAEEQIASIIEEKLNTK